MTIYEIIESVAAIGSTIEKQKIIETNKDNEVLKNCFFYAENPRFNFWIKVKTFSNNTGTKDIDLATFTFLNQLIKREITGDAARNSVEAYMGDLTGHAQEILARIINKDLRCNAGTAIANKVWKNLIPEYPVLLCSKYDAKAEKYLSQFENGVGFAIQKKEDGGRLLVKVDHDGVVTYHSRNGSELNLFGIFDTQLSQFKDRVFDGELLVETADGKPNRKVGNGFYTKAVRGSISEEEAKQFSYKVWDVVPTHEYLAGKGTETHSVRHQNLIDMNFSGKISIVMSKHVQTLAECQEFYGQMRNDGQEGAIIKVANSVWEDSRSKNYVKLKNVSDVDALCIRVEPGTGKYAGMIGSLVCQDSSGELLFNVGTGLTDDDRKKDPSFYVNHIVECTYNEVISSKSKTTKSLFLPVFKQVRHDKNVANHISELK